MAKLGYLYLNNGRWDGRQILSPDWVAGATKNHATPPQAYGYGYLWWLQSPDVYMARGRGGQIILVMPKSDTVLVVTGGVGADEDAKTTELMGSFILPMLTRSEPLPPNPEGLALLEARTKEMVLSKERPEPVPPLPQAAKRISGNTYALDDNPLDAKAFSLTFAGGEEAQLRLIYEGRTRTYRVGLDNVFRVSPEGSYGLPTASKGAWEKDDVFALDIDEIANVNHWQMRIRFENDTVAVEIGEATWHVPTTINGRLVKETR